MAEGFNVNKVVLHILDNAIDVPVFSNKELEITEEITDFVSKHLDKIFHDHNSKKADFINDNNNKVLELCKYLHNEPTEFLTVTKEIAKVLFTIMVQHVDIAAADLLCCLFEKEGQNYLGILKMNYKTGYTHFVQQGEEGNENSIIRHKTILPSEGQKVDECALILLESFNIQLLERDYEINGQKEFYFSKIFLKCTTDLSDNEKLKIIDKVTKKINKKYFDEDFEKMARLKKVMVDNLEETEVVEVNTIADGVFENNLEVRNEYISEIQKAGLVERAISLPEPLLEKKFRTHKIKTDTGIEINFPLSFYEDKEKLEFINNPDGTISIVIKNIGKIMNR